MIKPGTVVNDICAHEDFIPTFAAAAGDADLVAKVKKGYKLNGKTFKVHLDGYNLMPFLKGEAKESPRKEFLYWSDDGDLMAIRVEQWKVAFMEQHTEIGPKTPVGVWQGEFTQLRAPDAVQSARRPVRARPGEHLLRRLVRPTACSCSCPRRPSSARVLETFKEFPPRAKAASFTVSDAMDKIMSANKAGGN